MADHVGNVGNIDALQNNSIHISDGSTIGDEVKRPSTTGWEHSRRFSRNLQRVFVSMTVTWNNEVKT